MESAHRIGCESAVSSGTATPMANRRRCAALLISLLSAGVALLAPGVAEAASPGASVPSGSWPYPNGDLANTRDATGSVISSANVSDLKQAWSFTLTGKGATSVDGGGALTAVPIVVNGVVYIQDQESNVYAISLTTGKLRWEHRLNLPLKSGPGPNGVAVANGTVFGASPTTVFALNAATGRTLWVDRHLLRSGEGTFGIQPQVTDGRVYLASQYGSGSGGGVLLGLNASTGKLLWRFNTVLGLDKGVKALGLGAGGAWETPLVGADGSVTFGIGNPYQSAASAIKYPSKILYTNSDVNLSGATGKLNWYYQGVPDDFKDYDMQASPIAADVNGVSAVIGGGKMGYVYAMNAQTGALIWKTPVGAHNGHDNDSVQALEHRSKLKAPYTYEPGPVGGILSNMALAGNSIYVVTDDYPFRAKTLGTVLGLPAGAVAGEIEALSLSTGKVEWDTKVSDLPLGAATVSGDLVFTSLYHGTLIALNSTTGAIVYRHRLPTSTNAPLAIADNTVLVSAGGPQTSKAKARGKPQLVAYTVP
ncbi:MAG: PQQ-binding-like beta-propeller repeat protein [Candidatus Dormiibacterota bacterium]